MKKSYLAHAALGAVALAVLAACSSSSAPTEQVPTTAQPSNLTSTFRYQIVLSNALTGNPITDTLQVEIKGTAVDADKVVDGAGQSVKGRVLTVRDGILALGAELTATTSFSVVAGNRLLGWNESGKQFTLATSQAGDLAVTIPIAKVATAADIAAINANPNVGISVASATAPVSGGALQATQVASVNRAVSTTEGTTANTGVASIQIPAGTRVLNAQGQPVTPVGTVSLTVTAYSPENSASLDAFPGGFAANVNIPAGSPAGAAAAPANEGTFVTGGFAQFNMTDSAGNALKTFDRPVSLSIPLPKSTLNEQGVPIQAGEQFPVWSFDEVSGVWKFERMGTVREKTPVDASNFEVVFESTHLSSWNLDYYQRSCTTNFVLQRGADTRRLRVVVNGVSGRRVSLDRIATDSNINLLRSPQGATIKVDVYDGQTRVGGSTANIQTCSTGTVIPLTLAPANPAAVAVNITESCSNGTGAQRGSPAPVTLMYAGKVASGTAALGTNPASAASVTLSQLFLPSTPISGTLTIPNRYTGLNFTQAVTLTAGQTTTANVNFANLRCTTGGAPL